MCEKYGASGALDNFSIMRRLEFYNSTLICAQLMLQNHEILYIYIYIYLFIYLFIFLIPEMKDDSYTIAGFTQQQGPGTLRANLDVL